MLLLPIDISVAKLTIFDRNEFVPELRFYYNGNKIFDELYHEDVALTALLSLGVISWGKTSCSYISL